MRKVENKKNEKKRNERTRGERKKKINVQKLKDGFNFAVQFIHYNT